MKTIHLTFIEIDLYMIDIYILDHSHKYTLIFEIKKNQKRKTNTLNLQVQYVYIIHKRKYQQIQLR